MKITIIGAGAMGGAMAEGLLKSENFTPSDITVSDHNQPVLDHFASEGASVTLDNQLACHGADIVCVVVKPWCVEKTLKGIKDVLDYKSQKLVVVAAGVPSANIKEWLDKDGSTPTFFLVMPNIAIAYKQSMTFITPIDASATESKQITDIFDELGESLIMEERLFPAATAMSCAIAYAMRYVRANAEGIAAKDKANGLTSLLEAQLTLVDELGIDTRQRRWHRLYMNMLTAQLYTFRRTETILLKPQRIALSGYATWKDSLKALLVDTIGLRMTCRLFKTLSR